MYPHHTFVQTCPNETFQRKHVKAGVSDRARFCCKFSPPEDDNCKVGQPSTNISLMFEWQDLKLFELLEGPIMSNLDVHPRNRQWFRVQVEKSKTLFFVSVKWNQLSRFYITDWHSAHIRKLPNWNKDRVQLLLRKACAVARRWCRRDKAAETQAPGHRIFLGNNTLITRTSSALETNSGVLCKSHSLADAFASSCSRPSLGE